MTNIVGNVDRCDEYCLAGWVVDLSCPDLPVAIDIEVNATYLVTAVANKRRPDMAGRPGGEFHGFEIALPSAVFNSWAEQHVVVKDNKFKSVILTASFVPGISRLSVLRLSTTGACIPGEFEKARDAAWGTARGASFAKLGDGREVLKIPQPAAVVFSGDARDAGGAPLAELPARHFYLCPSRVLLEPYPKIAHSGAVVTGGRQVFLETLEGAVSSNGLLLDDSQDRTIGDAIAGGISLGISERKIVESMIFRPHDVLVVQKEGWQNYAIWLTECLPRAYVAYKNQSLSEAPLLFKTATRPASKLSTVYRDSLELAGVGADRIIWAEECWTALRSAAVISVTDPRLQCRVSLELMACTDAIRRKVLDRNNADGTKRRIYVSRADAKIRKISNDADVAELLGTKYGFEVRSLSGMSFAEQVTLFASAEIVVGAHGAGLANFLFTEGRGTALVEIATPDLLVRYVFRDIAFMKDAKYCVVLGSVTDPRTNDFSVELSAIDAAVGWAVEAGGQA